MPTLKSGQKLDQYEIVSFLGSGGMGEVYLAKQISLERTVALKILPPSLQHDEEMKKRFLREAKAMARVSHPHVVTIFEVGECQGVNYFAMEYLPKSLAQELGEAPMAEEETVRIMRQKEPGVLSVEHGLQLLRDILAGLEAIHEEGIVHRDLKPQNILITAKGRAKIADFGIARLDSASRMTMTQARLGTEAYAAPEQWSDAGHVDQRADIYSMGVLMYRMWTGRLPQGRFKDPRHYLPDLPIHVEKAVIKSLEMEPSDRFTQAKDLASALFAATNKEQNDEKAKKETSSKPKTLDRAAELGIDWVRVPAGSFEMGDLFGDGYSNEKPVHEVYLDEFFLARTPVTVAQYRAYCDTNGKKMPDPPEWGWFDDHPIVRVSWYDAVDFCNWLGARLPTEAEWEYAAREGGKKIKWAGMSHKNKLDIYAWFDRNSWNKTHAVAKKRPNSLGLYDMSGNVWEWCSDWYGEDYYGYDAVKNPQGPETGEYRILRGGSWDSYSSYCRASYRDKNCPGVWNKYIGFRIVLIR